MSAAMGHDAGRIVEYFAAIEQQNAGRVVNLADQGPYGRAKPSTEVVHHSLCNGGSTPPSP
jgi:hypothetical protein